MKSEAGVYALVMSLEEERTIKIGKLGTFDFDPGWYVYLGSAHGPGGVKRRTDRHRRDDEQKPKKWNVDHFRPFATMHEIWFSHAPKYCEHDWAWSVMRMYGAKIPVLKFGANDCFPRCDTHFFYFVSRPFLAEFRGDLARLRRDTDPIYVEFIEPPDSDPVILEPSPIPSLVEYDRGRRVLEICRRAAYDGFSAIDVDAGLPSFAKGTPGRHLVEKVAPAMSLSVEALISAAKFAHAVDEIARNSEQDVFGVLFDKKRPQNRKAIMRLSRTSDVRQRYRIEGVAEGQFRSVAPQHNDSVFDTVAFGEVPSRLARARGALEKLGQSLEHSVDEEIRAECHRLVKLCQSSAKRLRSFLKMAEEINRDLPKNLAKDVVIAKLERHDVQGETVGLARLALRLTIKSVWDFPEMQRRKIQPTNAEREKTNSELDRIIAASKRILAAEEVT